MLKTIELTNIPKLQIKIERNLFLAFSRGCVKRRPSLNQTSSMNVRMKAEDEKYIHILTKTYEFSTQLAPEISVSRSINELRSSVESGNLARPAFAPMWLSSRKM